MEKTIILFLLYSISVVKLYAQEKAYHISFLEEEIKIDGIIDNTWDAIAKTDSFIQTIPTPFAPSSQKSEVKLVYSSDAIYILAKLFQDKKSVKKQLTPRDNIGFANADVFAVFFDTYHDKQNGFAFRVSAAGVQQDERIMNSGNNSDVGWDAVWESKVKIYDDYWVVEMKIPFQALRFPEKEEQIWGLQFFRLLRKQNENSYWNTVDQNQSGFLTQSGTLKGLNNIHPPTRLILFPYLSTGYQSNLIANQRVNKTSISGGMDIKYGINEAFTLDMTLVPDFSQVVSDNLIRNTSAFEQQLNENRPFFTEGVELFNKQGLFYSRRIGARPSKFYEIQNDYGDTSLYKIERNPNIQRLYNSFKISGRTKDKLGLGIFNAITAPAYATILDKTSNKEFEVLSEGMKNYNVFVMDKTFKGQSFVNFTNTNVWDFENKSIANVSAVQNQWYMKDENYVLESSLALSTKTNEKSGTKSSILFNKIAGKLRFGQEVNLISPQYRQNDLGLQYDFNLLKTQSVLGFVQFKPRNKNIQFYNCFFSNQLLFNYQPFDFRKWQVNLNCFVLRKSFWDINYGLEIVPVESFDYYQLGSFGKKIKQFPYVYAFVNGSSDSRKKFFWSYYTGYGISTNIHDANYMYMDNTIRYRFSDRLEISLNHTLENDRSNVGFSYFESNLNEPIIAYRNIFVQSVQCNVKLNFSPTLNITGRFRHYNTKIMNRSFHTVDEDGSWRNNIQSFNVAYNENFNIQNVDIFLNWIFAPGSRFIFSYKKWLNDAYIFQNHTEYSYGTNLIKTSGTPQSYELALRCIYYLDYNKIKNQVQLNKNNNS